MVSHALFYLPFDYWLILLMLMTHRSTFQSFFIRFMSVKTEHVLYLGISQQQKRMTFTLLEELLMNKKSS